jgi:hypothetical protein
LIEALLPGKVVLAKKQIFNQKYFPFVLRGFLAIANGHYQARVQREYEKGF